VNPPRLTPEQRLQRGIDFIARAAAPTPSSAQYLRAKLTMVATEQEQKLGALSWVDLLEYLTDAGNELGLFASEIFDQLQRRVEAAHRQANRTGGKPPPRELPDVRVAA
jgi:cell division septum initiation protein DivIVA